LEPIMSFELLFFLSAVCVVFSYFASLAGVLLLSLGRETAFAWTARTMVGLVVCAAACFGLGAVFWGMA